MNEIPEAIGTAALGAAAARAVEPARGGAGETPLDRGHFAEAACLNCGTALAGRYCSECGQAAHLHRTFGAFMHDILHGVLHLDGKTWRTLPMLALRPGRLTRDYIDGQRARYVSPMALFLFSVFLMFAVFQIVGIAPPSDLGPPVQFDLGNDEARREAQLAGLEAARENIPGDTRALDEQIAGLEREIAENAAAPAPVATGTGDGREILAESADGNVRLSTVRTGWNALDQGIDKWRDNPSLMAYKLQSNGYKFSWLLIPLSLPFVALLFLWRRRFGIYDHAVFVTYSLAFMSLMFVALSLLGTVGVGATWLFTAFATIAPLHIYKQLRGTYELSRFSAIWRLVMLLFFITAILILFLQILLVLGAY